MYSTISRPIWQKEELDFLLKNYQSMTQKQLADKLGKTENDIKNKSGQYGLRKKQFVRKKNKRYAKIFNHQ